MSENQQNTTTTTPVEAGYFTGILDVYFAKMNTPDTADAAPTYGTPFVLGKSIEVTVTPQYREGSLYASNRLVRAKRVIDRYDIKFNADVISPDNAAIIFNRTVDDNGVQILDGDADPVWGAVGLCRTKDNGEKEYWWLYRAKFTEPTISGKTDADKIEYQTPTIEGRCERRIHDNRIGVVADSEDADIAAATLSSWFTEVYEAVVTP